MIGSAAWLGFLLGVLVWLVALGFKVVVWARVGEWIDLPLLHIFLGLPPRIEGWQGISQMVAHIWAWDVITWALISMGVFPVLAATREREISRPSPTEATRKLGEPDAEPSPPDYIRRYHNGKFYDQSYSEWVAEDAEKSTKI
jgi:hypothetical protein